MTQSLDVANAIGLIEVTRHLPTIHGSRVTSHVSGNASDAVINRMRLNLPCKDEIVAVKDSPIHGKGLFAGRALRLGEILLRMDPDSFSQKKRHPWNGRNRDVLPFFINHSCDPNTALVFLASDKAMSVIVTRAIASGAEVTLDYCLIELGGRRIPCLCGTDKCRGSFPVNLLGAE